MILCFSKTRERIELDFIRAEFSQEVIRAGENGKNLRMTLTRWFEWLLLSIATPPWMVPISSEWLLCLSSYNCCISLLCTNFVHQNPYVETPTPSVFIFGDRPLEMIRVRWGQRVRPSWWTLTPWMMSPLIRTDTRDVSCIKKRTCVDTVNHQEYRFYSKSNLLAPSSWTSLSPEVLRN